MQSSSCDLWYSSSRTQLPGWLLCRLLRQDMTADICDCSRRCLEAGGIGSLQQGGGRHGRAAAGVFTSREAGPGTNDLSVFLYRNVQITSVTVSTGTGAYFQVCPAQMAGAPRVSNLLPEPAVRCCWLRFIV